MSSESDDGDSALPSTSSVLASDRELRKRRNSPSHPPTEATKKALTTPEKNVGNTASDTVDNTTEDNAEADESSMGYPRTSLKFEPSKHLPKECIVEAVDDTDIEWWENERDLIETSFGEFVQRGYFVNKYKFLEVLLLWENESNVILLPSGFAKTVMSVSLQYFFSFNISAENRNIIRPFYSEFVDKEMLEKHEGQYYVLRISFQDFPYKPSQNFGITLNTHLLELIQQLEPELFKDQKIEEKLNSTYFIKHILDQLHKNYNRKLIVIIDEVDQPATKYLIENASPEGIRTMLKYYDAFLTMLYSSARHKNAYVEKVILFGIHPPPAVFDLRRWTYFCITDKTNWASYFLFTRDEVKLLLTKYDRLAELDKVVQHYGGYNDDHFLPASVVAYVRTGKFAVYKSLRRNYDVLNIDSKMIKSHLLEFIDGKLHEKKLKAGLRGFSLSSMKEDPMPHYAYAGLLCVSFEGTGGLRAGNLENLNIIAFFLESVVDFNYPLLEKVNEAFRNYDLPKLSKAINTVIGTFKPLELCNKRCYQIAIKVVFYLALREWTVLNEVDEGTGQPKTEASGRIDLRVSNNDTKLLYIFELEHLSPNRTDISVARLIEAAFKQIEEKGYVSANDEKEFEKIYEVAVVCSSKIVKMRGQLHQASK